MNRHIAAALFAFAACLAVTGAIPVAVILARGGRNRALAAVLPSAAAVIAGGLAWLAVRTW